MSTGATFYATKPQTTKSPISLSINWGKITSYAILLVFTALYLGPIIMLVNTALKTESSFMKDATSLVALPKFDNFAEAWEKANFVKYMGNSVIYVVSATV